MKIIVTGRHLDVSTALRGYAEEKIKKIERYLNNVTEAVVTLSVEKYRHKAEVQLKADGLSIHAEGVTGEMYSSIDQVMDKIERQVKKFREKLIGRKGKKKGGLPLLLETPREGFPRIIKRRRFEMKPMSPEEAVVQMELLDKDFFVFTNDSTGDINVIYRRKDRDVGLIEPIRR